MWDNEGSRTKHIESTGLVIYSCKSYMFVSFIHVNTRTKEKLIKSDSQVLKMLPYLKSDGTVSPCGSFPFLAVMHRVCGTLHGSSLVSYVFLV